MKQETALKVLGQIMNWPSQRVRSEFRWLSLMSRLKFDGYADFLAGVRFLESLAAWLQQFEQKDRETAYKLLRHHLLYISTAEMQHLVDLLFAEVVHRNLMEMTARRCSIPVHMVWATPDASRLYSSLRRKTLFFGLSDGARMDMFRRANAGLLSNEQVVVAHQIGEEKWQELLEDLRSDTGEPDARFESIYLIDDFVGSGKTLLRQDKAAWKGKLPRFWRENHEYLQTHFTAEWGFYIHHYIATEPAARALEATHAEAFEAMKGTWTMPAIFSFGMLLPDSIRIVGERHRGILALVDKYFDPSVKTKSIAVGGTDGRLGFADCALPVVLEHNTPNNSIALLWAETAGANGAHAMRPVFRRRQRHS